MRVTDQEINKIIAAVRKEPLTIKDVSKIIKKSWVTTEKYVNYIKEKTGVINVKVFRKGTQAAIKIVYPENKEAAEIDKVKKELFHIILNSRFEQDFDFMEVFQFIPKDKKNSTFERFTKKNLLKDKRVIELLSQATNHVYILSGNLSYLGVKYEKTTVIDVFEELLKRKVFIKILTRVDMISMQYISKLNHLIMQYPELLEIRHRYQPLRGFIVDDCGARFKNDEHITEFTEKNDDARVFYEVYDCDWVKWLEKVFWYMFNSSITYSKRYAEIESLFK